MGDRVSPCDELTICRAPGAAQPKGPHGRRFGIWLARDGVLRLAEIPDAVRKRAGLGVQERPHCEHAPVIVGS